MKFALQYLHNVDLILMNEDPADFFKESNHNQISAIIGGVYSGNPASKGRDSSFVSFNCPTFATSNYKVGGLIMQPSI